MRSQLAEAARCSLTEDVKRMTPEQRLAAFLAHCQLMAQLQSAGGQSSNVLDEWRQVMRTSVPGQSVLLMTDVAEILASQKSSLRGHRRHGGGGERRRAGMVP
jgi:hypothetical protein